MKYFFIAIFHIGRGSCRKIVIMASILAVLLLPSSPVWSSQDINTIRWAKPHAAPIFIRSGDDKNTGLGDKVYNDLQLALPQYKHHNYLVNHARMKSEIARDTNVCAFLHKTPERERLMTFSDRVLFTPGSQLYIRSTKVGDFYDHGGFYEQGVDLDELLTGERDISIGILTGRSYGFHRDAIIGRHHDSFKIIKIASGFSAPVKMLIANRLDMIVEYPWLMRYHLSQLHQPEKLVKLKIQHVPAYDITYITCPKTAWGRSVIEAINPLLASMRKQFSFYQEEWLSEVEAEEYRQFVSKYIP